MSCAAFAASVRSEVHEHLQSLWWGAQNLQSENMIIALKSTSEEGLLKKATVLGGESDKHEEF